MTGSPEETVGHQLGTIAKLIIWLVGIMAALSFLGVGQILAPINELVTRDFRLPAAADRRRPDPLRRPVVARIVQRLVETVLIAANIDGLLGRIGIDERRRRARRPSPARAATPGAARASHRPRRRCAGVRHHHHPDRDRAPFRCSESKRSPARRPRCSTRSYAAIPRMLAAALWIGIAFIIGRFLKTIIESILPPTGFDHAVRSTGVLPGECLAVADRRQRRDDRDHPRRVDRGREAARRRQHRDPPVPGHRAWRQGDFRHADHRRRHFPRADHRQPGRQRNRRGRLCPDASSAMRSSPCSRRSA